ncbi:MAG: c-type cytochrome [Actinomycetota bacterium]|nr:c-type cytochrome [Actinomycetota bacterium]MDQ2981174.1 c-type cytochrome [Actinomycetota bacterium]
MRGGAAVFALAAALLAGGCGTGGISKGGDTDRGKKLFLAKCAGCHTLAAAGTHGNQGPNLDDAFASSRRQGFKQVTIEQVVRDQIELSVLPMPQNLVTGSDADAVAAYVAMVAGNPSAAAPKNATSGKEIFLANCGSCHTLATAGTNGQVGPNLDQLKPGLTRVQTQVINGGSVMPAFKGQLTAAQITAVAKYVASVAGKR